MFQIIPEAFKNENGGRNGILSLKIRMVFGMGTSIFILISQASEEDRNYVKEMMEFELQM